MAKKTIIKSKIIASDKYSDTESQLNRFLKNNIVFGQNGATNLVDIKFDDSCVLVLYKAVVDDI